MCYFYRVFRPRPEKGFHWGRVVREMKNFSRERSQRDTQRTAKPWPLQQAFCGESSELQKYKRLENARELGQRDQQRPLPPRLLRTEVTKLKPPDRTNPSGEDKRGEDAMNPLQLPMSGFCTGPRSAKVEKYNMPVQFVLDQVECESTLLELSSGCCIFYCRDLRNSTKTRTLGIPEIIFLVGFYNRIASQNFRENPQTIYPETEKMNSNQNMGIPKTLCPICFYRKRDELRPSLRLFS